MKTTVKVEGFTHPILVYGDVIEEVCRQPVGTVLGFEVDVTGDDDDTHMPEVAYACVLSNRRGRVVLSPLFPSCDAITYGDSEAERRKLGIYHYPNKRKSLALHRPDGGTVKPRLAMLRVLNRARPDLVGALKIEN